MRFTPLMNAPEAPRFVYSDGFEAQTVDAAVDEMRQPGTGVFDALRVGGTGGRFSIVAPPGDPILLTSRVPIVEPHVSDRAGGTCLFEPGEKAGLAVLAGFDFDDHTIRGADS